MIIVVDRDQHSPRPSAAPQPRRVVGTKQTRSTEEEDQLLVVRVVIVMRLYLYILGRFPIIPG